MLTELLVEFLLRLTFGVAFAMGITPSKWVTSGFYRIHLWVLLGLQTLAALAAFSWLVQPSPVDSRLTILPSVLLGITVAAAAFCYVGGIAWLYDRRRSGKIIVWIVAALALAGSIARAVVMSTQPLIMHLADPVSGGLLLGLVTTAMLLGHWYLNTPTMKLEPLKRLIMLIVAAVALRALVSGVGLLIGTAIEPIPQGGAFYTWLVFISLRWLAGIGGVLGLALLTWQTLKIPNTQSATGILYAAVTLAFIGELMSQLLSAEAKYPL